MKSLRTKIAAVVLAVAAMVAAPAAANAYTPGAPDVAAGGSLTPGGAVTLSAAAFDAGTTVSFTVSGENGSAITLAAVKTVVSTSPAFTATTNASGNASVAVKLPANASGTYTVAVTGLKNGATVTETTSFAVSAAAGPGGNLPATGVDSASLMGVWIGGGVLLLGGLAVTVFAVRRQRQGV
ncbi:LPXTG cell wall anchor domain-containing protein [Microbacterium sp. NPDC089189]|uniref:LPXTG cell wall anchor domain-containing protein n=1 Tax=Microbacterium sp. NPDC089189 TaxID=3154972 RepID=UPI00341C84A9